ncbi:hypothetical protein SteCoe_25420 [Stentor coeruleus]|uniref:L-serine-phosphatidylethanolamine phosphatidyltransferase n=1 Tax=Stentor coeruleus TaxID=5963 RepID=A0A1R2BFC3_9CILI|nr:hypothetical protein SteCoe_25420 [Stentor coeruleus]
MKDVAVQTQSESTVGPRVLAKTPLPEYEFPQILYKAHTVLWLQAAILVITFVSLTRDDSNPFINTKAGMTASFILFTFISAVHLPNSPYLSRPHPVFWRILQGISFCYLAFLTYILYQNLEDSRKFFSLFDSNLGKPLPEKSYAANCEVFTPNHPESYFANIKDCIFDVYIPCHALGWWFKMIIVRDVKLCAFLSVLFEFMEITLRHQLPNFYECWWDSLILDVIICNGGGIFLGWLTCRAFEMKEYYWGMGGDPRTENERFSALSRSAIQLTPYSWSVYKWEMFSSSKNFVTTLWYIVFVNLVDLSNFYLKFILWIPSNHSLLLYRVLFWATLAIASTREYYEYVSSGFKLRLGTHCWIAHLIIAVEWLIVFKNSGGIFNNVMPMWLQYAWSLIAGFLIAAALCLFYKDLSKKSK